VCVELLNPIQELKDDMKSIKRISKVVIKRMADTDPDTSWLGEYSSKSTSDYSIDRKHATDCTVNTPHTEAIAILENAYKHLSESPYVEEFVDSVDEALSILESAKDDVEDCDCGGHGDMERNEYRYFNPSFNYIDANGKPEKGETPETVRKYTLQDYERMESLNRGNWCFIGIRAEAEIVIPQPGDKGLAGICQEISSGGLSGIDSDSDRSYFEEIEAEELSSLRQQLTALGFSKRAIATAFKNVEHKEE
jgi:hypothetical protein